MTLQSDCRVSPEPEYPASQTKGHRAGNLLELVRDMASNTGMQGPLNIKRSNSLIRKSFWLLIFLTGVGMLVFMVSAAVIKYYKYPTKTTIDYIYSTKQDFPAVSICNLNALRSEAIDNIEGDMSELFGNTKWENFNANPNSTNSFEDEYDDEYDDEEDDEDADFRDNEEFIELLNQLNRTMRVQNGHNLTWMLVDCTFNGFKCSHKNFTLYLNARYGNCWAFHIKTPKMVNYPVLSSTHVGPQYGLTLTIFIDQLQYLVKQTDEAGLRVMIHNASRMPFPEDNGFSVPPGYKSSVGIEKVDTRQSEPPYGTCQRVDSKKNQELNAYVSEIASVEYTSEACKKTCYQRNLVERCKCYDSQVPWNSRLAAYAALNSSVVTACGTSKKRFPNGTIVFDSKSTMESECQQETYDLFSSDSLDCSDKCKPECEMTKYQQSISQAIWPTQKNMELVINELYEKDHVYVEYLEELSEIEQMAFIRDNVLKLQVYYTDLGYQTVVTAPSYRIFELLSELGGQAGLWLGASVVALFELAELIVDIFVVIFRRKTATSSTNTGPKHDRLRDMEMQKQF